MESADAVVVTVSGRGVPNPSCGVEGADSRPSTVTLATPLGARPVRDGTTGARPVMLDERVLPRLPVDYTEPHTGYSFLDGTWFTISYTRIGGPDLSQRPAPDADV